MEQNKSTSTSSNSLSNQLPKIPELEKIQNIVRLLSIKPGYFNL